MFLGMAFVGLIFVLSLYASGNAGGEPTLFASLFLALGPVGAVWQYRQMSKGTVKLSPEGLLVRARMGANQTYRWEHIAEVRLSTLAEHGALNRLWARLIGASENAPFVELRLSRSLRVPLVPGQHGTAVSGIPTLMLKKVALYIVDPEGFVEAAQPFLGR
jgi:hypothetical protein